MSDFNGNYLKFIRKTNNNSKVFRESEPNAKQISKFKSLLTFKCGDR